jgi:tetrahydromethanopterin S-methyltransferase subunit A|tara:strand:+ start:996 stop:1409 length:414 start_codon:yes stop_codon:yes gene_type:complete
MKNNQIIQGRWYKINKKINKRIKAKYHKIKDWVMDPKGYFLIAVDREKKILRVGYCIFKKIGNKPINDMVSIISGKTAIEIVNTLIKNKYISSYQHAADMGIELCKAELALKYKLDYIQDKDLIINKIKDLELKKNK